MATRVLATSEDFTTYDHWIKNHPHGNLWQSLEWKEYQEKLGREVRIYVTENSSTPSPWPSPRGGGNNIKASALVVIDRTTFGFSTWDIPRGPLWENSKSQAPNSKQIPNHKFQPSQELLDNIIQDAKKDKCMSLYLSPDPLSLTLPPRGREHEKLKTSHRHEQPEATRMIDLLQSDDSLLKQMKSKGRYNIGVAEKHGVEVQESHDIDAFYELLKGTSERDGFKPLPKSHYKIFLENLPGGFLLLAYIPQPPLPNPPPPGEGTRPIAGLLGVMWGDQALYYYGASDYAQRACMAPYLLQWEAMRYCRERGCKSYDLLGIVLSDPLSLALPPRGREQTHPWAGVSKFKEQFGGTVIQYPPEQELVLRPWVKKALQVKRHIFG